MTHIDDNVLDEYAIDVHGTMPGRAAIESRLNVCLRCRLRVASTTAFLETIASPESWETADALLDTDGHERRLITFASRVQSEYTAAMAMLAPSLQDALAFVQERIERKPEFRTAGTVRLLVETAHASCEREPIHARNIAEAAVAIADQLPISEHPASVIHTLRGVAWKERANAMRFIGEYPDTIGDSWLPSANLLFGGSGGAEKVSATTDQDGHFTVTLPRRGKWIVDVEAAKE